MIRHDSAKFLAILAVAAFSSAARAEEGTAVEKDAKGAWDTKVDLVTRYHFFGYTPSKILESRGKIPFASDEIPAARMDMRARLTLIGKYLRLDLQPYTVVPEDVVRVNIGGLEADILAPVTDSFRVGLYHHSSHNFSDATYGWGTDLNAVVIDADLFEGKFSLGGEEGAYRLHPLSHWYWKGRAPSYLVTRRTEVVPVTIASTQWRGGLDIEAVHSMGRSECGVIFLSPEVIPSSMSATCAATFALDDKFFGAFGEHLFVGPFLSYGQNFGRISEFGRNAFYGGLQIDLVFVDTVTPVP